MSDPIMFCCFVFVKEYFLIFSKLSMFNSFVSSDEHISDSFVLIRHASDTSIVGRGCGELDIADRQHRPFFVSSSAVSRWCVQQFCRSKFDSMEATHVRRRRQRIIK